MPPKTKKRRRRRNTSEPTIRKRKKINLPKENSTNSDSVQAKTEATTVVLSPPPTTVVPPPPPTPVVSPPQAMQKEQSPLPSKEVFTSQQKEPLTTEPASSPQPTSSTQATEKQELKIESKTETLGSTKIVREFVRDQDGKEIRHGTHKEYYAGVLKTDQVWHMNRIVSQTNYNDGNQIGFTFKTDAPEFLTGVEKYFRTGGHYNEIGTLFSETFMKYDRQQDAWIRHGLDTLYDKYRKMTLLASLWGIIGSYGHRSERMMWSHVEPDLQPPTERVGDGDHECCTWKWLYQEVVDHQLVHVLVWAGRTLPNFIYTDDMLCLLIENQQPLPEHISVGEKSLRLAAKNGRLDILKTHGCVSSCLNSAMEAADHWHIFDWVDDQELQENQKSQSPTPADSLIPQEVFDNVNLTNLSPTEQALFRWVATRQTKSTVFLKERLTNVAIIAAHRGYLGFLETFWPWLKDLGQKFTLCKFAIIGGQLQVLQWISYYGSDEVPPERPIPFAQECNQFSILHWLECQVLGLTPPDNDNLITIQDAMCRWYLDNKKEKCIESPVVSWIINSGKKELILDWFIQFRQPQMTTMMNVWKVAIDHSDNIQETMRYFLEWNCTPQEASPTVIEEIIDNHTQVITAEFLEELRSAGFPFPEPDRLAFCLIKSSLYHLVDFSKLSTEARIQVWPCLLQDQRGDMIKRWYQPEEFQGEYEQLFVCMAIRSGQVRMLEWLSPNGERKFQHLFDRNHDKTQCKGGCFLDCIIANWVTPDVFNNIDKESLTQIFTHLEETDFHAGHRDVLDYLYHKQGARKFVSNYHTCKALALRASVGLLKWFYEKQCFFSKDLVRACEKIINPSTRKWLETLK